MMSAFVVAAVNMRPMMAVEDQGSWQEEADLQHRLHKTQYGGLAPHSTGAQGAFARAMGRHEDDDGSMD